MKNYWIPSFGTRTINGITSVDISNFMTYLIQTGRSGDCINIIRESVCALRGSSSVLSENSLEGIAQHCVLDHSPELHVYINDGLQYAT